MTSHDTRRVPRQSCGISQWSSHGCPGAPHLRSATDAQRPRSKRAKDEPDFIRIAEVYAEVLDLVEPGLDPFP